MRRFVVLFLVLVLVLLSASSIGAVGVQAAPGGNSCWGQASAVFAQTGAMGKHASQQPTPRLGLRNLARALHEADVIPNDSMQALGTFVANELGLTIEACQ